MNRRDFFFTVAAPIALARVPFAQGTTPAARKGRIKQGVTRAVFPRGMALEDCCRDAARLGVKGFDLIGPAEWPTKKNRECRDIAVLRDTVDSSLAST